MSEAAGTPAAPPDVATRPTEWSQRRVAALAIGTLLALLSLALLGGGGTALWADRTQRDDGYVTTDVHEFSTSGSALTTVATELGSGGTGWLYSPAVLDKVRIRVTPARSEQALFVGIGPTTSVERYLAGVSRTVISEFRDDETEFIGGHARPSAPGEQGFWAGSAVGHGPQTLVWDPADGSWTVVVMNADGRAGLAVGADLGAELPALPWIALAVVAAGAIFAAGGALLITSAVRRRPD